MKKALMCLMLIMFADSAHARCLAPGLLEPMAGSGDFVSTTPTLRIGYSAGSLDSDPEPHECGWLQTGQTEWQIAEQTEDFPHIDFAERMRNANFGSYIASQTKLTHFAETSGGSKASHTIPGGVLRPGTEYYWRARIIGFVGNKFVVSPYSRPQRFTTHFAQSGNCVAMPGLAALEPRDNSKDQSLKPSFRALTLYQKLSAPCQWDRTEIKLSEFDERGIIAKPFKAFGETHGSFTDTIVSVKSAVKLKLERDYLWQVRAVSTGSGVNNSAVNGPWSHPVRFTTLAEMPLEVEYCRSMTTPDNHSPPADAVLDPTATVKLSLSYVGLSPGCTWDKTAWQILDAETGSYVYQTGFIDQSVTQLSLPDSLIQEGRRYLWRAKAMSQGSGEDGGHVYSDWSESTGFSIQN